MAYPKKSTSIKIGPFKKGIDNVEHPEGLGFDELVDSVNFLHDETTSHLRPGYARRLAGTNMRGVFAVSSSQIIVFSSGDLLLVDINTWDAKTLKTGFSGTSPTYERIGPRVFFSTGTEAGRLHVPTGAVLSGLGTPSPAAGLALAPLAFGELPAGTYRAGITQVDSWGEESGCSALSSITLPARGGIGVTLSATLPFSYRLYLSEPNGAKDELFQVDEFPGTWTSVEVTGLDKGRELETLYLREIPPPSLLTLYNGRLYFALENRVYYSPPLRYGLYHPRFGLLGEFPERVTVLEQINVFPTGYRKQNGIFVVADKVYAHMGQDPADMDLRSNVWDYPAAFGSGMQVDGQVLKFANLDLHHQVPYWFTPRGPVIGLPGGDILPLTRGVAEPDKYARGASGVLEHHGFTHVVTAVQEQTGPRDSVSLGDSFGVRVIKH
jgi:hypothetical protein